METHKPRIPFPLIVKKKIFVRDNYKCRNCNSKENLQIHHINNNPCDNSLDNLVLLCFKCHKYQNPTTKLFWVSEEGKEYVEFARKLLNLDIKNKL